MNIGGIRPGMALTYDGTLYMVINCEHSRQARGAAFCRTKLRDVDTGKVLEKTLRDSDNVEQAYIEKRKIEYTYPEGDIMHFMDIETYEDLEVQREYIEDDAKWLKENTEVIGLFYKDRLLSLELPPQLDLIITESEPAVRGDTVKAGTKSATLETGAVIQVPLFVEEGTKVTVNPRTGEYLSRA